eukprot:106404_1
MNVNTTQSNDPLITINFFDENDNKLNFSHRFKLSSQLSPLFDHISLFHPLHDAKHSDFIIKPRLSIDDHHSGWDSTTTITIAAAIKSLNYSQMLTLPSFDFIITLKQSHPIIMDNFIPSEDDNQTVYTINTHINNHLPLNSNFNLLPTISSLNHSNTNNINTTDPILNPLNNLNYISNIDNTNINMDNNSENDIDLPPDLQIGNDLILSRQYVRTVHKLLDKDIVIPAPAIPNDFSIIKDTPIFPNCNNNTLGKHVCFKDDNDIDLDIDFDINVQLQNENKNKQSYLDKIYEMNKNEQGPYADILKKYPKRSIGNNPQICTIWNHITVPSLASYLQSKKEQRAQETDYNLLKIRMGSKGNESVYSQQQNNHNINNININNNNNNNNNN